MPAFPRKDIVLEGEVSTYHCVSRCVRRAFLCGKDSYSGQSFEHRKAWVKNRLSKLARVFAIDIGAYTIMSNHIHLNLRIRPDLVEKMDDEEIIQRWWRLFPKKIREEYPDFPPKELVERWQEDAEWIAERRKRLCSISWFMRCLCEYIARRANAEDGVTGRFWEGRFKSQVLLDDRVALAANLYIDLNPIRAGVAKNLEDSEFTSIKDRILNMTNLSKDNPQKLDYFLSGLKEGYEELVECSPFLLIDERDYISVLEWYGRQYIKGKKWKIPDKHPSILDRIGFKDKQDLGSINQLFSSGSWAVGDREDLKKIANRSGRKWIRGIRLASKAF